ncbi:MAG: nitrogenase component 1 [Acidaminococcaceae bacterium]|nr:nitrogenase component 1 [Acidaminococcaceae bacterium]
MKPMSGCALIGAARALSGIRDAVVLQHSVVGCHWGSLAAGMLQQPDNFRQASTVIYEENVIRGGMELIPQGLTNIVQLYPEANAIFVVSGCIPNMIGDDVESAIAAWQEENPGHRVLHIPAPGYAGHEGDGIERALLALLPLMEGNMQAWHREKTYSGGAAVDSYGNMVAKPAMGTGEHADLTNRTGGGKETGVLPKVNLLGLTASDPYSINDVKYLRRIFAGKLEIVCALQQCSIEEIARMGRADLNIVFGRGVKLAERMQKQFGMPYICCDYPYGIQGMLNFLAQLENKLSADFSDIKMQLGNRADSLVKNSAMYLTTLYQLPAALVGDSAHLSGMQRFLQDELGMETVIALDTDTEDQNRLERDLKQSEAVLLLGSSYQAELADRLTLPMVRYVYPVVDEVCLTEQPMIGAEGTAYLLQQIVNAAMRVRYKTEGVFGGLRVKDCGYNQEELHCDVQREPQCRDRGEDE